jgi:hypothetical protein
MELKSVLINRNLNPANQCGLWVGAVSGPRRSSSVHPDNTNNAYDFNGRDGNVNNDNRSNDNNNSVRCVVRAAREGILTGRGCES